MTLFLFAFSMCGLKAQSYVLAIQMNDETEILWKSENGVNEFTFEQTSFVYPNPAKDNIRIIGLENQDVEIFSADGKLVMKAMYDGKNLNVSSLPKGFYLIKTNGQTLKFNKI